MMIVMKSDASEADVASVVERVKGAGARAHVSTGEEVTVIGAIGDREHVQRLELEMAPGVDRVVPITKPYKLASEQIKHGEQTVLEIGGRRIGGPHFGLIARPPTLGARGPGMSAAPRHPGGGGPPLPRGGPQPPPPPHALPRPPA